MAALKGEMIICASCSASLTVQSGEPGVIVCSSCGAVINKDNNAVLRKVTVVPEDMSVIRLGTTGKLPDHTAFEVIGRYRIDAEDGYFNLWNIRLQSNGSQAWIIDSFGEYVYATSKPLKHETIDDAFWTSSCNWELTLPDIGVFTLVAKPKLVGQNLEGEIPEMPEDITTCRVYELADAGGKQALLIKEKLNQLIFISGDTLDWSAYHFENIRKEEAIGN